MRWLYSLAWALGLPLAFLYLLWRARRQPEYLQHWSERLGFVDMPHDRPLIWIHAVSVGETHAAAPLIRSLQSRHPEYAILLTHATPTGREAGRARFGPELHQAYLPYDLPWVVRRFLERTRPALGIIMETEIWPNLYHECARLDIPLYLVNARLSERSARGYARLRPLVMPALTKLTSIAAQTEADAERLRHIGADHVTVAGNLKFEVVPAADTANRATELRHLFGNRFVLLAASTREGEETLILDALSQMIDIPELLLVIVPRHPQRFDSVARLIEACGLPYKRRSQGLAVTGEERVFLGDSMGELAAYYRACDLALIGGSLLPFGGQNLIEAALAGKPILLGPHTWNFEQASIEAVQCGAALRVQDGAGLIQATRQLYGHDTLRKQLGAAGIGFAQSHQGATERILSLLAPSLEKKLS